MRFFINWLCIYALIFSPLAQAQTTATMVTATDSVGIRTVENLLKNPGAEVSLKDITASGGTLTRSTSAASRSGYGVSWDSNAVSQTLTFSGRQVKVSQSGYAYIWVMVPSGTATHKLQLHNGTNVIGETPVVTSTSFLRHEIYAPLYAGTTVSLRALSVASNEPEIYLDDGFLGEAFGIQNVAQAQLYAMAIWPGTAACNWSTTSSTFAAFAADSDCTFPSGANLVGKAQAPATKIPAILLGNSPPGYYKVTAVGSTEDQSADANQCNYTVSDGTTNGTSQAQFVNGVVSEAPGTLVNAFTYNTSQTSLQFEVRAHRNTAGTCGWLNNTTDGDFRIIVEYFPLSSDLAISAYQQKAPTIQKFTSGSSTYFTPYGSVMLKVRMVGGGGGGGGGGTTDGTAATAGGNTTFGTSLLSANGGSAGNRNIYGPVGGGYSLGTGPIGSGFDGMRGGSATSYSGTNSTGILIGGYGGSTVFGGGGTGGSYNNTASGSAGTANTGAGGGGGGVDLVTNGSTGSGGGAGGFVDAIITNPSSSYPYAVGAGGSGQLGGTNGGAGGAGAAGYIEVTEFYSMANVPLIIGSVTSNSTGSERIERAALNCDSSSAITSQSGSWLTSIGNRSSGCSVTIATGIFSAAPTCSWNISPTLSSAYFPFINVVSATSLTIYGRNGPDSAYGDNEGYLLCMGPR